MTTDNEPVLFALVLVPEQAWALAELCKRIGFAEVISLARDEGEACEMSLAVQELRFTLARAGYAPR